MLCSVPSPPFLVGINELVKQHGNEQFRVMFSPDYTEYVYIGYEFLSFRGCYFVGPPPSRSGRLKVVPPTFPKGRKPVLSRLDVVPHIRDHILSKEMTLIPGPTVSHSLSGRHLGTHELHLERIETSI